MKIACDRCEKVTTYGNEEYNNQWRSIEVFKAWLAPTQASRGAPSINSLILCDDCYDKLMDFVQDGTKANPCARANP